jgi:methylmalonyl-CoA mutase
MTSDQTALPLAAEFPVATRDQWMALVAKALKGADFDKRMVYRTADGLRIDPLYTRSDALPATADARPGVAPFTRGTRAARPGLGWDISSMCFESDPPAANAVILEDLAGGATSLVLQLSSSGGPGLPPTREAIAAALKDVLLDVCPVGLVPGEVFTDAAAALLAVWEARGIAADKRLGAVAADPLGTMARQGGLSQPIDAALKDAAALALSTQSMPGVTALMADGHPYHTAGASEAQELAAMLSTLVAYLRACERAGLAPADALPKILVGVAADADQFLTIAKLRAARRLVWRVAEAAGAGAAAAKVRLASATSYRMMAKRDPWTNILRTTIACAGAVVGGADSIVVLPFTFALGKPDSFARRIARNVQVVLQEESNLGRVTDPAGGSWYIEKLTDDLANAAWKMFQELEAEGGIAAALASGSLQARIKATATARDNAIATGRMELTGVSAFPLLGDDGVKVEPWPAPKATAKPFAVTVEALRPHRLAEPFEALRDAADAARAKGHEPKVFLASLGEIVEHNVRSTWVQNYLASGGIACVSSDGYATAEAAADAFKTSGTTIACICSSDALYAERAETTAKALRAAGAKLVLMAGRPGDAEAAYRAAGVGQFLFAGADAIATLQGLLKTIAPPA